MRKWFWRSGLGPRPSRAAADSAHGRLLPAKQPTAPGSTHTRKGSETVSINPKKKSVTSPITNMAPAPSGSCPPCLAICRYTV